MADDFRYMPGIQTKMGFVNYNPYQTILWEALNEVYQARLHGRINTLLPSPWFVPNMERYNAWRKKFVLAHASEAKRDKNTRGWELDDLPDTAWLYLFERMVAADSLKPPAHTYYDD